MAWTTTARDPRGPILTRCRTWLRGLGLLAQAFSTLVRFPFASTGCGRSKESLSRPEAGRRSPCRRRSRHGWWTSWPAVIVRPQNSVVGSPGDDLAVRYRGRRTPASVLVAVQLLCSEANLQYIDHVRRCREVPPVPLSGGWLFACYGAVKISTWVAEPGNVWTVNEIRIGSPTSSSRSQL